MEFENLLTLIKTVSESKLTGFKYEENGVKINLSKQQPKQILANVNKSQAQMTNYASEQTSEVTEMINGMSGESDAEKNSDTVEGNIVKSPLVGTFYTAPSEDAEPFVSVGSAVKKGQTMAIVEAMKLMNEIESDFDGTVAEVYVENGQAVEYGQPLFRIS